MSEVEYRRLVQAVTDYAIYMLSPAGIISSWNAGAQRIKGYAAEEVIGRHYSLFFTDEDRGFATKADKLLESIAGRDHSLLVNRIESLQKQIDTYDQRISAWNDRLDKNRERLTNQFYKLEETVAKIQSNLTSINQIQFIKPISSTSG